MRVKKEGVEEKKKVGYRLVEIDRPMLPSSGSKTKGASTENEKFTLKQVLHAPRRSTTATHFMKIGATVDRPGS